METIIRKVPQSPVTEILPMWTDMQVLLPQVPRWRKFRTDEGGGVRPQDSSQHSHSIVFVGSVFTRYCHTQLDGSLLLTALAIHDVGEGYFGVDTHYIDKTHEGDLKEYLLFKRENDRHPPRVASYLERAFLLQFARANPTCFPEEARLRMHALWEHNTGEVLAFEAIERLDYVLYALEQYLQRGNDRILVRVLRNQLDRLNELAVSPFLGFPELWTEEMRKWCEVFVADHEGQWIEQKGEV